MTVITLMEFHKEIEKCLQNLQLNLEQIIKCMGMGTRLVEISRIAMKIAKNSKFLVYFKIVKFEDVSRYDNFTSIHLIHKSS